MLDGMLTVQFHPRSMSQCPATTQTCLQLCLQFALIEGCTYWWYLKTSYNIWLLCLWCTILDKFMSVQVYWKCWTLSYT